MKTIAIGVAAVVALLALVMAPVAVTIGTVLLGPGSAQSSNEDGVSDFAKANIPAAPLAAYRHAAQVTGAPWEIIAGIGKVECDHGQSTLPGCHSGSNFAGAEGPMQFLASTWAHYRQDCGGGGDVYDIRDAACGAGAMLMANGVLQNARQAIFAYNHDWGYVASVLSWASKYVIATAATLAQGVAGTIPVGAGGASTKVLSSGDPLKPLFANVPPGGFPDTFPPGQCTWYAAWEHRVAWTGNAGDWWANARAQGAAESSTPSVGAIAVWRPSQSYSVYGHVGVVVQLGSGGFVVSEMNYVGWDVIDTRWVPSGDPALEGFIT